MIIGGHFTGGPGILGPFDIAEEYGVRCFQMFIGSNSYRPYDVGEQHREAFRARKASSKMIVAAHGPYLPNVCATNEPDRIRWSIDCIVSYIDAADKLDIEYMVFHPGSHKTADMGAGIHSLIQATLEILDRTSNCKTKLLWENTAGGGTQVGHVENVATLVEATGDRSRLGMCVDTVHAYADGHSIDQGEYRQEFWKKYESLTDWVHLNNPDQKVCLGSHLDRHRQNWLDAKWPVDVMLAIAREWGESTPLCMESDPSAYEVNLMVLDEAGFI